MRAVVAMKKITPGKLTPFCIVCELDIIGVRTCLRNSTGYTVHDAAC